MASIYAIYNLINDKIYVGQTTEIYTHKRWKKHIYSLRNGKHNNSHLQSAWNKYGETNFKFIVLEECLELELDANEQIWIDSLNSMSPWGYNMRAGGRNGKHSDETRRKLSVANMGRHHSDETRKKMSIARSGEKHPNFGKHPSSKTREKLSAAHMDKHPSNKTREKMSASTAGEKHPNFGKHLSEETREKISAAKKGKHLSDETREKISAARKGKHHSDETRKKISAAHMGKCRSEESRAKQRVTIARKKAERLAADLI